METSRLRDTYKPSELLQVMVDGLIRHKDLPDFKVDMGTFGHKHEDIYYGCATACALSELMGTTYPDALRRYPGSYGFGWDTGLSYRAMEQCLTATCERRAKLIDKIETAIDCARCGNTLGLWEFGYTAGLEIRIGFLGRFHLENDNWETEIPKVIEVIRELQALGY